jgi:hypothetical protein
MAQQTAGERTQDEGREDGQDQSLGDGLRTMARQMSPSEIDPKIEEAFEKQPLIPHLLSFRVVVTAVVIGAVVALVLSLLVSPVLGGIGLLVAFFAAWFIGANRSYGQRRPTKDEGSEDDGDEEPEGSEG